MSKLPEQYEQVTQVHASLINMVVQTNQNMQMRPQLNQILKASTENGWENLVLRIYKILDGERSEMLLKDLDEEDAIIIEAILKGIQDPSTLPDPTKSSANPTMAAPGIAHMVFQASHGDAQALTLLSNMAEQMSGAGGDMARLAAIIKNLLDGERDPDVLSQGMGAQGDGLVNLILEELAKLNTH
ncbi:MAG: hypothetical protein V3U71_02995 [Cocleimonas sp.]